MKITTIGLDIAKNVFQVHGVDASGQVVVRRRLRRGDVLNYFERLEPCLIGIEACAGSHHWGRQLIACGHEVRLMPPQYVRPYVKRNKNDATDAEAICEAVMRPQMRFVPVKSAEQQSVLMLHRARELMIRQRTMLVNAMRGHCGELGIVVAQGVRNVATLMSLVNDADVKSVPPLARRVLNGLGEQLTTLQSRIVDLEREIVTWHRQNEASSRLQTIPGVGPITASAIVATVANAAQFRSGREFAAWIGLVPKQHSSGGKERLGGISKRGDAYLRRLLIHGARTVVRWQGTRKTGGSEWLQGLLVRRHVNVAAVAVANKNARIAWAVLSTGEVYQAKQTAA